MCFLASRWEEVGGPVQTAGLGCADHPALVPTAQEPGEAQHVGSLLWEHVRGLDSLKMLHIITNINTYVRICSVETNIFFFRCGYIGFPVIAFTGAGLSRVGSCLTPLEPGWQWERQWGTERVSEALGLLTQGLTVEGIRCLDDCRGHYLIFKEKCQIEFVGVKCAMVQQVDSVTIVE